ncbi:MAG: hypothetical protein EPO22_15915, partial [Dehalococcoidia bacterium]
MPLDVLRRVPAFRSIAKGVRASLTQLRPLPAPRYLADTPNTAGTGALEPYFPPTISTLARAALSEDTAAHVLGVLDKLTPTPEIEGQTLFYKWAQAKFREQWQYADVTNVLAAASLLLQPKSYLEIGVRRGRSSAVVGALAPDCAMYAFDVWLRDYGGI